MRKGLFLFVAVIFLLGLGTPSAHATNSPANTQPPAAGSPTDPLAAQLQAALAQQQQISADKTSLQNSVAAAQSAQQGLISIIKTNQKTIEMTTAKLAQAEQQFRDASAAQKAAQTQADEARHHEITDKLLLAMTMRSRYNSKSGTLSFLLSGSSFNDLIDRADALQHVVNTGHDLVVQLKLDEATAEAALSKAQTEANAAQAAATTLSSQNTELQSEIATEAGLISQLDSQTRQAHQEILAANGQDAALVDQITQLRTQQIDQAIAAAEAADWAAANFYVTNDLGNFPGGIKISQPQGSGQFQWPARGTVISQGFGPTTLAFEPAFNGFPHFHTGLDLAGALDTPVVAAADGVVVSSMPGSTGYGNHIIIDHGNSVLTLYGHLDHLIAQVGQTVHKGDLIGLLGSSGNSTGPHLHFEVRVANQPVDPISFLPPLPPGATGP